MGKDVEKEPARAHSQSDGYALFAADRIVIKIYGETFNNGLPY